MSLKGKTTLFQVIVRLILLITPTFATRKYERRSDLDNVPPISATGWTVPLYVDSQSLPAPGNRTLTALAVGRGNVTWNCTEASGDITPIKVLETAYLYDVAPLIQVITTVSDLNAFVGNFLNFDYSQIDNSTFQCIGTMQATNAIEQCYDLTPLGIVDVNVTYAIGGLAPFEDLPWTYSINDDYEVYMVETQGGHGPTDCGGQPTIFDVAFAAEFWFYH